MKMIITFTFLMMAVAVCVTVWFVSVLKPTSNGAFAFFAIWLISPYAIMSSLLISLRLQGKAHYLWYALSVIECAFGVLSLADMIFWQPDAQGAIAVFLVPILQGTSALILLVPISWLMSRYEHT